MAGLLHCHLPPFLTDTPSCTHCRSGTDHGEAKQAASLQTWAKEEGKETSAEGLGDVGQTTRLLCHIPQCWHSPYLHSITVSPVVIQRGLWVPGQFLVSLMSYQIMLYQQMKWARDCSLGPKASWHHTARVHMAKPSYSPEQGGSAWGKASWCIQNHTMAHAVSLTIQMFTSQCLVCEALASSHPCLAFVRMRIGM